MSIKVPTEFPACIYTIEQIRSIEQSAMQKFLISEIELMEKAGADAFEIFETVISSKINLKIAVFCGPGNNGGDGFIFARLAAQKACNVCIYLVGDFNRQTQTAKLALQRCKLAELNIEPYQNQDLKDFDFIIDAILGIGYSGSLRPPYKNVIECLNQQMIPIVSLDCPSGLDMKTGKVEENAIKASHTITFIGLKPGFFLADALEYYGKLYLSDLQLPEKCFNNESVKLQYLRYEDFKALMTPRPKNSHKFMFGHVLVIGGDYGFAGAALLSAKAALHSGAGLVSVATRPEHVQAFIANQPEIMCHGISDAIQLDVLMEKATVIILGPGLGQSGWAKELLNRVLSIKKPKVIDADALNLIAQLPQKNIDFQDAIFTPHPGEAGRLLEKNSEFIQKDRVNALEELYARYHCVTVLKGAYTLIRGDSRHYYVSPFANPAMASAGMGDVLSGVIAAFIAQKQTSLNAAILGVIVHGMAAELLVTENAHPFIATEVIHKIKNFILI